MEVVLSELNSISNTLKQVQSVSAATLEQLHSLENRFAELAGAITVWTKVYGAIGAVGLAVLAWGALQLYGVHADLAVIKFKLGID